MLFWHRFRYYSFFSSSFVWIYSSSSPSSFILRVPWTSTDGLRLRKKHHGWEKRLCFQLHYSIQAIHFYLLMNVILKDNDPIHVFNCLNTPSCLCLHSFKVLNRNTALSCLPFLALRDNVLISQSQMTRGRADKLPTFSLRDAATVATTTAGRLITTQKSFLSCSHWGGVCLLTVTWCLREVWMKQCDGRAL